ncbi:MAG TPA: cyclopropane-fatty-acyl-phospholipid synthase family protein, partial [Nevskiales bacterium]|nr:cyclopropane-fatty-acyl-phospholipid synthase family protein [Nevskiales bacterium]
MQLKLLDRYIRQGTLHLQLPDGRRLTAGRGEPSAEMILHRPAALVRMLRHPAIAVGEAYMDGDWDPGEGGLLRVFEVIARNLRHRQPGGLGEWLRRARSWLGEIHPPGRSRRNVESHYDLDEALFRRFLDADLHYSCAYFERPGLGLEEAQQAKCRHIARKLLLQPGEHVLDIGSGWGGLALHLARSADVRVTGLTLSQDQYRTACRRALDAGLADRVRFELCDYRQHEGRYDAIVSVGMFEHVGRPQYPRFFEHAAHLLRPGGRMLLHTIGRSGPPAHGNHWIRKYIFPGGYIPALSEIVSVVERTGLFLTDIEVLRLHYADTLRRWR